jgi:cation transport ATPase
MLMNLLEIIFFGWYHILDKTVYSLGANREGIGPKEHSFVITFLFHGMNLWTILRYLMVTYYSVSASLPLSLSLLVIVFVIGYFFFFKKASRIITSDVKNAKAILFVAIALAYVIVSVYLMFQVGNYARYQLGN